MNRLFNSVPEMQLRIVFLLAQFEGIAISSEMIVAYDFISVYGKEFDVSDRNLHGNSPYKFGEISSKRQLVQEAIKNVVLDGLVEVDLCDGYQYRISRVGAEYVSDFNSKYGKTYSDNVRTARKKYGEYNETALMKLIRSQCKDSLERRD